MVAQAVDPQLCGGALIFSGLGEVLDGVYKYQAGVPGLYTRAWRVPPAWNVLHSLLGLRIPAEAADSDAPPSENWVLVNQSACSSSLGDQACLLHGPILAQCQSGCPAASSYG